MDLNCLQSTWLKILRFLCSWICSQRWRHSVSWGSSWCLSDTGPSLTLPQHQPSWNLPEKNESSCSSCLFEQHLERGSNTPLKSDAGWSSLFQFCCRTLTVLSQGLVDDQHWEGNLHPLGPFISVMRRYHPLCRVLENTIEEDWLNSKPNIFISLSHFVTSCLNWWLAISFLALEL